MKLAFFNRKTFIFSISEAKLSNDDSNVAVGVYADPDVEFDDVNTKIFTDLNNKNWERQRTTNDACTNTTDDFARLSRVESSLINLEPFLTNRPSPDVPSTLSKIRSAIVSSPTPTVEDTLSDVDLDKFDASQNPLPSISRAIDERDEETLSLSNFHNVRDVLMNIKERLESCLKNNQGQASESTNLEGNISDLKRELDFYLHIINEKKENELRKFSENLANHANVKKMNAAFSSKRRENPISNIYETLNYAIANNASRAPTIRQDGFTLRSCYDNDYIFGNFSDFSSEEYYTMLINEENSERLLKDAPPPGYSNSRDMVSLIFRDPECVIRQWQNYQLKTIQIDHKKKKSLNLKWKTRHKCKPNDFWGFTLDHHQNRALQRKLQKERRLRFLCRLSFYFFSLVCFILIVLVVQSLFQRNVFV